MKLLKCCVLLLSFSCLVFAEEKPALKVVRVTGTAEVKAVPDRAMIELGVEKESPSASQAKSCRLPHGPGSLLPWQWSQRIAQETKARLFESAWL